VLNEPYGSDIANGMLYVADRDGGTTANEPSVAVVRRFNMRTGAPAGEIRVERVGVVQRHRGRRRRHRVRDGDGRSERDAGRIDVAGVEAVAGWHRVDLRAGCAAPKPNGVAFDSKGNIVVVNVGDDAVLTFSRTGQLVTTEHAAQAGNDGLVIMPDGTKYVSSVLNGGVSRIRPGKPAELIARNIPSAASMCYDAGAKQLVIR
jgi:hypothetical protein